jgi:hypothetical protein
MNGSVVRLSPDKHGRMRYRVFLPPATEGGKTRRPYALMEMLNTIECKLEREVL